MAMDWLILILGVPAILVPLVLLFGFAGCATPAAVCNDDADCPAGTECSQNACVVAPGDPAPPSAPDGLAADAFDDQSVSLVWHNNEPAAADVSFEIERTPTNGAPVVFPVQANLSPTGAASVTDAGLEEGVTFIYRVRAVLGEQHSEFRDSNDSSATVLPAAPAGLAARPVSINQIDLQWTNVSRHATRFSLERRDPGGTFAEIFSGDVATNSYSDPSLAEGTQYDYQVFALVAREDGGVEHNVRQNVKSAPSATVSATTLAFTAAFTAPPGTLTTDQPGNEGICLVQRLSPTLLAAGGTQVRITLRGSTAGSLTLDKIAISQVSTAAGSDPYDPAPDRIDVAGVTIPAGTLVTVGPVNYTLDNTKDLLVAFDISNTPGEGNLRQGALTGADSFASPPPPPTTAEAGVPDRTTGYVSTPGILFLVEKIEVL